jgi:hypothetical protein
MQAEKRRDQIIIILSSNPEESMTATQIHDELYDWFGLDVCRKTVTRDIDLLIKRKDLLICGTYPPRYYKSKNCNINVKLSVDEITLLLTEITTESLKLKFKKLI